MAITFTTAPDPVLEDTPATLTITADQDGAAPTITAATVTVTRANGSTLVNTTAATVSGGDVSYTLAAADTSRLDDLRATWTLTIGGQAHIYVSRHAVVGNVYFTEAEFRALNDVGSTTNYTDAKIIAARAWIETLVERNVGVAFVRRFARVSLDGTGDYTLTLPHMLPRQILSVAVLNTDGTTSEDFDATDLADIRRGDSGVIRRSSQGTWPSGAQNLVVEYVHGFSYPPADVKEAALDAARLFLLKRRNRQDSNLTAYSNEFGSFQVARAGLKYPTGYDDIDAVIMGYAQQYNVPALA